MTAAKNHIPLVLVHFSGHTNATSRIGVSQREAERRGPHVAANQSQPIQITLHSLPDPVQHNHHRSKLIIQTPPLTPNPLECFVKIRQQ